MSGKTRAPSLQVPYCVDELGVGKHKVERLEHEAHWSIDQGVEQERIFDLEQLACQIVRVVSAMQTQCTRCPGQRCSAGFRETNPEDLRSMKVGEPFRPETFAGLP